MSYSTQEAKGEEQTIVQEAILNADDVTLRRVANHYAKQGDDELADHFSKLARKAVQDQWAYDEAKGN